MEQLVTIELFGQPYTFKAQSDVSNAKEVADHLVKEVTKIETQYSSKSSVNKLATLILAALNIANENIKLKNTDVDGVLQYETIPGSEGGVASGLGFLVSYDTRNNIYFPTQGSFHQAYIVFFDQLLGSDYQFNLYTLDLRKYYSIFNSQVAGIPNA